MSKYPTNRASKTKAVRINIDLEISEEEHIKSLIQKGHDLLATLEGIKEDKLQRTEDEIARVKKSIEDIGKE